MATDLALLVVGGDDLRAEVERHNVDGLPIHSIEAGDAVDVALADFAFGGSSEAFAVLRPGLTLVRPVRREDLLLDGAPVPFLSEHAEERAAGTWHEGGLRQARTVLGVNDPRLLGLAEPHLYESATVRELVAAQSPDGSTAGLLAKGPRLHAWYAAWLLATRGSRLEWREPIVASVLGPYSMAGATDADIARGYVGFYGPRPAVTQEAALAELPPSELARSVASSMWGKAPRVQRALARLTRRE